MSYDTLKKYTFYYENYIITSIVYIIHIYCFRLHHKTQLYSLEKMRRLIAVVLVVVVGAVLVAAHPATQEVNSDSELDDETARKIIGSR